MERNPGPYYNRCHSCLDASNLQFSPMCRCGDMIGSSVCAKVIEFFAMPSVVDRLCNTVLAVKL